MPRRPKIYDATHQAASCAPFPLLDGTLEAAQSFVDAITTSAWWLANCAPTFNGEVPLKVLLQSTDNGDWGAGILCEEKPEEKRYYDGRHVPVMQLGPNPSNGDTPPAADVWTLLHELAHVWEYESWHDKKFIYAYCKLVHRFLGIKHHAALVQAMRDHKIRLNYRSILNG